MPVPPDRHSGLPEGRSLLAPSVVLAALVLLAGAVLVAQELVATVAFAALAAVICRRIQLVLVARGVGRGLALTLTVLAFVAVIGALGVALVASLLALRASLVEDPAAVDAGLRDLAAGFAGITGLPPASAPEVDTTAVLGALQSLISAVAPVVTSLVMATLILVYLLFDADRLRLRMLRATTDQVIARYDSLATELVVYIKVRAGLGAAAAVGDTILLLLLGVPYAFLWGVVSFLFSFVPNIGFIVALVPPTILAFQQGGIGLALAVVGGYTLINLAFDYVLQPRMMSVSLDLSPVVVIVSIMVWTLLVGPLGALLAVPLTITMRAVLLPFPGARWFVALLGPIPDAPEVADPVAGATREPTIGA